MRVLVFGCISMLVACDNSQAFHDPHPSLERMQTQERLTPFDEHGMNAPPPDTVARDRDLTPSTVDDAGGIPIDVDLDLLTLGRESFDRVCATCHGVLGNADSIVASKMKDRPPPSLLDGQVASLAPQANFDVITQGYGLMPSCAHMLDVRERWSVVAYLDALRLSRRANVSDLPTDVRRELEAEATK